MFCDLVICNETPGSCILQARDSTQKIRRSIDGRCYCTALRKPYPEGKCKFKKNDKNNDPRKAKRTK